MVVAVIAVRMVEVAFHQVVDVIAVGNGLVATAGAVDVASVMRVAGVAGRALVRVRSRGLDHVLFDAVAAGMMEVTVVEIVDVTSVPHGRVAAVVAVHVIVVIVDVMAHRQLSSSSVLRAPRRPVDEARSQGRRCATIDTPSASDPAPSPDVAHDFSAALTDSALPGHIASSAMTTSLSLRLACSLLLLAGCTRVHLGTHDAGGAIDGGSPTPCGPTSCAPGLSCCNASCGICTQPGESCSTIVCTAECSSNADCEATEYCARAGCAGEGTCVPRLTECPPEIRPTCGCDGNTYASPCDANASGVGVLHDGECEAPGPCDAQDAAGEGPCDAEVGWRWNGARCEGISGCSCTGADCALVVGRDEADCRAAYAHCDPGCSSNADCGAGRYCHFGAAGSCAAPGECRAIPGELPCPPGALAVCGCDGADYACELAAHQVGSSVAHVGSCGGPCAPMDAIGMGACRVVHGYRWNGSECEPIAGCTCEGAECAASFDTFAECEASYAACEGACGPEDATGVGACFLTLGYRWNGSACEHVGGCACEGTDCEDLPETPEACEAAHAGCT